MGDPQDFEHQDPQYQQPDQSAETQDPYSAAVEKIQYGTPEEGRDALIGVTRSVVQHERNLAAIAEEHAATQRNLEKLIQQNPAIANDTLAVAAIKQHTYEQQLQDLIDTGQLNLDEYRKRSGGRDPDFQSVGTAHEALRAGRVQGVKTHVELMDNALDTLESRFNIRRRARAPEVVQSETVLARQNRARDLRGLPPLDSTTGEPVEDSYNSMQGMSSEDFTRQIGFGDSEATSEPKDSSSVMEREITFRRQLRGQRPSHFLKQK
jgi:hypothetical protein